MSKVIVECDENPDDLIPLIGDRYFSITEEEYQHKDYPYTIRILDCEFEVSIDISADDITSTEEAANSLIKLLNQNYKKVKDD